jgi:hypothetical protein
MDRQPAPSDSARELEVRAEIRPSGAIRSSLVRDTVRVFIHGREQHIPTEMVGFHAAVELAFRVRINPSGLVLRRKADRTYLGASAPVGDVLRDGDELEFAPRPELGAAA